MIKYHKILPYTLVMAMLSSSAAYAAPIQADTKEFQTVASASNAELKEQLDVATASDATRQEAKDIIISMKTTGIHLLVIGTRNQNRFL